MIPAFADNIKKYRELLQYTQQQLADMLGVNVSQICRYEKGESLPSQDNLRALVKIFRVSADELLGTLRKPLGETEEGERRVINIERGQICRPQFFSRVNENAVTIYPDGIRFSSACVRKWEEVEYINIIIEEDQLLLIVRQSNEDDYNSQRWCKRKDERLYGRKITGREFAKRLYRMMKWCRGYVHKISGYSGVNEADISEELWYFDLTEAEGIPMTCKGRAKCGVPEEDIDSNDLEMLISIERKMEEDRAKRQAMLADGKTPGPVERYIIKPDKWGQYYFGPPENLQQSRKNVEIR